MAEKECISVALRVRPLSKSEKERGCQVAVERAPGGDDVPQVVVNRTEPYTFNYVFDKDITQNTIYETCVAGMLKKLLTGYNVTILAYGQTGSGKTYTMGTAYDGILTNESGLIPRAISDLFSQISENSETHDFVVKCSFLELYQEQLFDLLSQNGRENSVVDIREDKSGIIIPGLTEELVQNANELTDVLVRGSAGRAVAATAMNETSSRSHSIFTVTISITKRDETKANTTSKFHFVDLAGSERCNKTQATGDRFKEGVNINKGLLALGNVISALGTGNGYVRYRDSKLTRLLQDSLGGNSVTLMIACVSPADYNVNETLSTLRYANRAKQIKNKPIVNQDARFAEINYLKDIIQNLRLQLLSQGCAVRSLEESEMNEKSVIADNTLKVQQLQTKLKEQQVKYRNLQQQLQETLHNLADSEMRVHIAEAAHEELKERYGELKAVAKLLNEKLSGDTRPEYAEHLNDLYDVICNIEKVQDRKDAEIQAHKNETYVSTGDNDEVHELLQPHNEDYMKKQIDFNDELRLINRELEQKQDLHQKICQNFTQMYAIEEEIEEKVKQFEQKISELENEKGELLDKLRHVKENASAKLAEQRRKRLQTLEQEIADMKLKFLQQSKLLKVREKETQKIQNLSSEIKQMKESKVKLIRAMRQESESFRQWKSAREKELMQLKNKDRKMKDELVRKEALHLKQRNVLKRKCEEAMAVNKRLKDALERQSAGRQHKAVSSSTSSSSSWKEANTHATKNDVNVAWIERELELILSLVDAEHSLEQLMEDRGVLSLRIIEIQKNLKDERKKERAETLQKELASMKEEIKLRNAQITDLQQKICTADLQAHIHSLSEDIQNVSDLQCIVKHLSDTVVNMRREHIQYALEIKLSLEEHRAQLSEVEQRYQSVLKQLRQAEIEHKNRLAELERVYEEKIALLLRTQQHVGAKGEPAEDENMKQGIIVSQFVHNQSKELGKYEHQKENQKTLQNEQANNQMDYNEDDYGEEFMDNSITEEEYEDDVERIRDPDWIKSPMIRRRKKQNTSTSLTTTTTSMSDTFTTAVLGGSNSDKTATMYDTSTSFQVDTTHNKSHQAKKCKCRHGCRFKRCGCYARNESCTNMCGCKGTCNSNQRSFNDDEHKDDATAGHNDDDSLGDENKVHSSTDANTFIIGPLEEESKENISQNSLNQNTFEITENATSESHIFKQPLLVTPTTTTTTNSTMNLTFSTHSSARKFFN